jgi:8-oxo-dGTP pyrophosphatase MutT (NUDIX family)
LDKVLFRNQYLAVIDRDGYIFSREVRCDGIIVCLLPFRACNSEFEFLARLEVCPAHRPDLDRYSITGGIEPGESIQEAARQELWEEAGYRIDEEDLINLGQVRPSKSADTVVHLFAVDVTEKPQAIAPGDGTRLEANASVEWVDFEHGIEIADPLFVTAITRLQRHFDLCSNSS